MKRALFWLFAALFSHHAFAQCEGDSVSVSLDITTDAWGYEMYWELIPAERQLRRWDCGVVGRQP